MVFHDYATSTRKGRLDAFCQRHFDHLITEFLKHYHEERPHQGLDNALLVRPKKAKRKTREAANGTIRLSTIRCRTRLGGLLKHYYRDAA